MAKKKTKRRLLVYSLFILAAISYIAVFGIDQWGKILNNRKETKELEQKYQSLLEKEEELNSEVTKLQDDEYVDKYARENDLYLIFQVLNKMIGIDKQTAIIKVLSGMKVQGISFESITRHRRKFLELHPELKDEKTEQVRREEEENYREEYSHGGYTC